MEGQGAEASPGPSFPAPFLAFQTCVRRSCGQCGGSGCSTVGELFGLTAEDCCETFILEIGKPCGVAPCAIGGRFIYGEKNDVLCVGFNTWPSLKVRKHGKWDAWCYVCIISEKIISLAQHATFVGVVIMSAALVIAILNCPISLCPILAVVF